MSGMPLSRDEELEAIARNLRPQEGIGGLLAEFGQMSDFGACIVPLLMAIGYRGDFRHVAESLPHFAETLDLTGFRNMMANMSYISREGRMNMARLDPRLLPCLFVPDKGGVMVLLKRSKDSTICYNGELRRVERLALHSIPGRAFFFSPLDLEQWESTQNRLGWFRMIAERFRTIISLILLVTFAITLLQIGTPLFVRSVYDKVVGSRSIATLVNLLVGIGIVILFDWLLRKTRTRMLMYVGARFDAIVSNAIFMRILSLTPSFTERAPVGAQVSRIKDFDTVREFFTGPLMMVFFEMPFTVVFFVAIAILGGNLALIPMITMVLFVALWAIMMPLVANHEAKSRRMSAKKQEFAVEALGKIRGIKYAGIESIWLERYRELAATTAMTNFRTAMINAAVATISHVFIVGSGVATIAAGVFKVLDGTMTTGDLVATMILVWRVLGPMQSAFMAMTRLEQVQSSIKQINGLMNVIPERKEHAPIEPIKSLQGYVSFVRVSIRYNPDSEPSLMGVSFDINPGTIVAVIGRNGSGKSTVVKLIAGLYQPQAGSIRIDGQDIRQMNMIELRHAIAYVPQRCSLFYGTIKQNLLLAHATASDEDVERACRMAGVYDEIMALPQKFWTRVGDQKATSLPSSMIQKISLARAYLKPSKIMLFDEPANTLDWEGDQMFMKVARSLRGQRTMFIVTHRPSHIRMADQILFLDHGYLKLAGSPEQILSKIPHDLV